MISKVIHNTIVVQDEWRRLSDVIRQIILATDMLRQPMYIDQLQTLVRRRSGDVTKRTLSKDNRLLVMQCMVKCADIRCEFIYVHLKE